MNVYQVLVINIAHNEHFRQVYLETIDSFHFTFQKRDRAECPTGTGLLLVFDRCCGKLLEWFEVIRLRVLSGNGCQIDGSYKQTEGYKFFYDKHLDQIF